MVCEITQVTDTIDGFNGDLSINSDGTRIAFTSNRDITGGNPAEGTQLFLFDTTNMSFTQVTNTTIFVGNPSINSDGTRIAFESRGDITGDNPDENRELFLVECAGLMETGMECPMAKTNALIPT